MKLIIYNFLILILTPVFLLRIFLKGFTDSDYTRHLVNRFGYGLLEPKQRNKKTIWFHAVSLGEVISSAKIVNKILENHDVILTVSTPTGLREANKIFGSRLKVVYAPWDFKFFTSGFFFSLEKSPAPKEITK